MAPFLSTRTEFSVVYLVMSTALIFVASTEVIVPHLYGITFYQSHHCRHQQEEQVNLICEVRGGYALPNVTIYDSKGSEQMATTKNEGREDGLFDMSTSAKVICLLNTTYICQVASSKKETITYLRLAFIDISDTSSEMPLISPIIAGTGTVLLAVSAAVAVVIEMKKQKMKSLAEQNSLRQRLAQQEENGTLLPDLIPCAEANRTVMSV
ncbi:uncharacterized protein LOC122813994 isoform X2 [Protopterus annectens]|uniref:uncharacterized protein LOC122813994 isoform X2 n=1 Tax=Protopterus annectens TaxID=7888 RepID=UPI001CFBB2FB|nr:uncharacterized protein LOC122813994 isoform X2 [Protopterus annectens]